LIFLPCEWENPELNEATPLQEGPWPNAWGEIHAARIIHKDINPANIIYNPQTDEVKVIDFGISARLPRKEIGCSRLPPRPPASPPSM